MLAVSYMGTKRHLAPVVSELVSECREGALLDLFSGMCAVGQDVAPDRQVWSNDLQGFAHLVAKCQFCNSDTPPDATRAAASLSDIFHCAMQNRERDALRILQDEHSAIKSSDIEWFSKQFEDHVFQANRLSSSRAETYTLFQDRYAGTYFGVRQCMEIDSLRLAIDHSDFGSEEREWCLVALCSAMAKCSNTTGHFAQALLPKSSNIGKVINQRKRSVWAEFSSALERLKPSGTPDWRANNRAFQSDAVSLLADLKPNGEVGVVYADPPYTADQYSRYYHLYETLILYDYPAARGRGLYRDDRAVSKYSHATKVKTSIEQLIRSTAAIKSDLIMSYPSDGLLNNSSEKIPAMIESHFGRRPDVFPIAHNHSTMGASKGQARRQVTEFLYRARC